MNLQNEKCQNKLLLRSGHQLLLRLGMGQYKRIQVTVILSKIIVIINIILIVIKIFLKFLDRNLNCFLTHRNYWNILLSNILLLQHS